MKYTEEYQQAYDILKPLANECGLNDEEIDRIIHNLYSPTAAEIGETIDNVIKQLNKTK